MTATTATQPGIQQLVNEFHINGFVVLEDLIPLETIDALYARCKPMMDRVEAWNSTKLKGDRSTGQGRVTQRQRFKIYPPFEMPFCDPQIFENLLVLELIERLWGDDDFELESYSSNCPAPGTDYQVWHRDGLLFGENLSLPVYPAISMKFPLVDTDEQNGSTQLIPCTHHCSIRALSHPIGSVEAAQPFNDLIESGRFPSKMRVNLKRGTAYLFDPRVIHRGMPNRSDHTRIELGLDYRRPWFNCHDRDAVPELTQTQFDQLSERGKRLLKHCIIVG
jgi:ectoine hydroxylase-related dioxygenase (phytanoyl-CoA dioxygenase family)